VPGDPSQVIYVWFDALANYITALDFADDGELYEKYWVENPNRTHCIGKDIIRFHAIYWPAMLLSAGVPLPKTLFVHGFINYAGEKLSKSSGVVIDPAELINQYGEEALRYYLLRGVNPTGDSDYSVAGFEARYNADLANDLGNLLNRAVSMIGRYRGGSVPEAGQPGDLERSVAEVAARAVERTLAALDRYDPQTALEVAWELVTRTNRYVEETAPWQLSKSARNGDVGADRQLDASLATLAQSLTTIAALLEPFLPTTAERIRGQLGIEGAVRWAERLAWKPLPAGTQVGQPQPIFPRLETPVAAG
jgi:methionyl-tRNA synthetase